VEYTGHNKHIMRDIVLRENNEYWDYGREFDKVFSSNCYFCHKTCTRNLYKSVHEIEIDVCENCLSLFLKKISLIDELLISDINKLISENLVDLLRSELIEKALYSYNFKHKDPSYIFRRYPFTNQKVILKIYKTEDLAIKKRIIHTSNKRR
jgi:hypothetical protein